MSATAVPLREGSYGDRVAAIEPGGVEVVPAAERHGRPRSLFWVWTSPNLEFATMYVGALAVTLFGAGFWAATIALVAGTAVGAAVQGILSISGPRLGVAQLVQSRLAFGWRGARLPATLQTLTAGAGWVAVNSVSGAFALAAFLTAAHLPVPSFGAAVAIVVAVEMVVALAGHNLIHAIERWLFPFLAVVFAASCAVILARAQPGTGFDAAAPAATGGPIGAFLLSLFSALAYAVSWNPYASDYSRYLPESASPRRVAWTSALGLFLACAVLEVAGAALATVPGTSWGASDNPTAQLIKPLPAWLGIVAPLAICAGAIAANVLNIYSAAMSALAAGVRLRFRWRRAALAAVFGAVGLGVALSGAADPGSRYQAFLFFSTYWVLAWVAVVLTDMALRHGDGSVAELFDRRRRRAAGVVAMLAGIAAAIPFMSQPLFTGWVAATWPQTGDLSMVSVPLVAAVVYRLLWRPAREGAGAEARVSLAGRAARSEQGEPAGDRVGQ